MILNSRIIGILQTLKGRFPQPGAMEIGGAYQALVGVLLSARTRDEQVIKLLPGFFEAFPGVADLAVASEEEIRSKINTIGMYKQKAKHLKAMAQRVVNDFDGEIPATMEDLTSLAGVGRKTASVILPYIHGIPAIAVDTHVHRVANRLGWVKSKTSAQTEQQLLKIVPPEFQYPINQVMVKFGRYICLPGKPRCWACPIADSCPFKEKNLVPPKNAEAILADIDRREAELERLKDVVTQGKLTT